MALESLAGACVQLSSLDPFIREDLRLFIATKQRYDLWQYFSPAIQRAGVSSAMVEQVLACTEQLKARIPPELLLRCTQLIANHQADHAATIPDPQPLASSTESEKEDPIQSATFSADDTVFYRMEDTAGEVYVKARVVESGSSNAESANEILVEFKRASNGEVLTERAPPSKLEHRFSKDETVVYLRSGESGQILDVHIEDPREPPYYTIKVGNQEIQTVAKWLKKEKHPGAKVQDAAKSSQRRNGPSSLAELQRMLADARRAGDHKESLRLMKLLPEFAPKPVDTDAQKAERNEKEKQKQKEAMEQMKQIKARIRQTNMDSIAAVPKRSTQAPTASTSVATHRELTVHHVPFEEVAELAQGIIAMTGQWRDDSSLPLTTKEKESLVESSVVLSHLVPLTMVPRAKANAEQRKMLITAMGLAHNVAGQSRFSALPFTTQAYYCRLTLSGVSTELLCDNGGNDLVSSSLSLMAAVINEDTPEVGLLRDALPRVFELFVGTQDQDLRLASAALLPFLPASFFTSETRRLAEMFNVLHLDGSSISRSVEIKVCQAYLSAVTEPAMMEHLHNAYDTLPSPLEEFFAASSPITIQSLLIWILLLRTLRKLYLLFTDTRERCTSWLQENSLLPRVLTSAFAILGAMRADEDLTLALAESSQDPGEVVLPVTDAEVLAAYESGDVRSLAQAVVLRTLRVLPALSRQFCNDALGRTERAAVMKLVREKVSRRIIEEEVQEILRAVGEGVFDSAMEIHASARTGSITTAYEKDGCQLEMSIRLSDCHPLALPVCECTKQVGVTQSRWRRWVIQIVSLLSNQDGSVLDAVFLFKQNLDKELEGTEPCPICYCVIHVQDHSMPRLACKTCSNKFHSKCIAKWFSTSHKNECPLCKQPF